MDTKTWKRLRRSYILHDRLLRRGRRWGAQQQFVVSLCHCHGEMKYCVKQNECLHEFGIDRKYFNSVSCKLSHLNAWFSLLRGCRLAKPDRLHDNNRPEPPSEVKHNDGINCALWQFNFTLGAEAIQFAINFRLKGCKVIIASCHKSVTRQRS